MSTKCQHIFLCDAEQLYENMPCSRASGSARVPQNEYFHEDDKHTHVSAKSTKATLPQNNNNGMCANVSLNDESA